LKVQLNLSLAPLDSTDVAVIRVWRNDYRIWRWCRQTDLISDVDQKSWFEAQAACPSIRMYKLELKTGSFSEIVGVCGLTSIDWLNRRAEFSLYIAPERQRRGYADAGLRLLLSHAFKNFGLHQIWGETFANNPAAVIFSRLGFKHDGTRRQFYWKDGAFLDAHLISITSEEWRAINTDNRNVTSDNSSGSSNSLPGKDEASNGAATTQAEQAYFS